MRLAPLLGLVLWAAPALAYAGPETYTLTLTGAQMLDVQKGLVKLPYEEAAPILAEMQRQLQAQTDAWAKEHPPPEKPK